MKAIGVVLVFLMASLVACGGTPQKPATPPTVAATVAPTAEPTVAPTTEPTAGLANPASVNCIEQGGMSRIESRPDGGQFGVCYFMDNYQCEEFALLRGDCRVGGVKVTGYVTDAGRYCAITGGTYAVTSEGPGLEETGTCTLPDQTLCDAQAYWEGTCPPAE